MDEKKRMEGTAMLDELRTLVGMFLTEFAAFESMYLTAALRALSHDATLVEYLEDLMDLEKRLRLLQRLAEFRQLPLPLIAEVKSVRNAALKLLERRNEVAHGAAVVVGATYAGMDAKQFAAGVRLPKGKRKSLNLPITDVNELYAVAKTWHRTTPEIQGYVSQTYELQNATRLLTERLGKHARGEP
jgi:hypothetical protein